jgi:hypothetical protein
MEGNNFDYLRARERAKDERDFPLGGAAPVTIPASFLPDNSWIQRNFQGQSSFCGEHAGTHLKAILDFYAMNVKVRKSPRYGAIKLKSPSSPVYDGFPADAGTDMRSIFKWLQKVGAADFEPLENNVSLPLFDYVNRTVITPAMDANAATSKIANYAFGNTDFKSLCQYIYQNKAVLLLIKCDDDFWGTTTPTFTTAKYGHFIIADGYTGDSIRVIDSADPLPSCAVKTIHKQFITPQFFFESGTAIDPVQAEAIKAAIVSNAATIVHEVADDTQMPVATKKNILQQIIDILKQLLPQKVGSASPLSMSDKYALNSADIIKIAKGLLIAVGGAAITYLLAILPNVDFGQYSFIIFPLASTGLNAALKYFQGAPQQ